MQLDGQIKVTNARILSVEKGNADKNVEKPVCAFTVGSGDKTLNIKALLQGELAKTAYHHILANGLTKPDVIPSKTTKALQLRKEVFVTFVGEFRELRSKEIVLDNLSELKFNFEYSIELAIPDKDEEKIEIKDISPATQSGLTVKDIITAARMIDAEEKSFGFIP